MRVFGTKQVEPTDEDRVAAERLSAVAARFKSEPLSDFTEATGDPLGEPEVTEEPVATDEPEATDEQAEQDELDPDE